MATPPALQGNTAIIGPDEPEALAWYQVLERRAVGRSVGLALLSGAGITLAALARPWTWFSGTSSTKMAPSQRGSLVAIPVGLSVVALIAGLRLRTKKYYKDPEALREYIQTYHNSSFAHAFKQFDSWEGLFRVATHGMIEAKIERELKGFIPGVQTGPLSFDQVWQLYNETSGHPKLLKEMVEHKVIDVGVLRALAMADLELSMENEETKGNPHRGHSSKPSGPPAYEDEQGDRMNTTQRSQDQRRSTLFPRWTGLSDVGTCPRSIIYRLILYRDFLTTVLNIDTSILQLALKSDPVVRAMTFDQLINASVKCLLTCQVPLMDKGLMRHKGIEYLVTRTPTFEQFFDEFEHYILDDHIMHASDFAHIFQRDCIDKLDGVSLIDKWYEWPIQHYGHSLGLSSPQQQLLAVLHKQLSVAFADYRIAKLRAKKKYSAALERAEKDREIAAAAVTTSNPSTEVPIAHIKQDGSTTISGSATNTRSNTQSLEEKRIEANFEETKARLLQAQVDEEDQSLKDLRATQQAINETWRHFLHPELAAKEASTNASSPVQLNLNFSLLGGLNVSSK